MSGKFGISLDVNISGSIIVVFLKRVRFETTRVQYHNLQRTLLSVGLKQFLLATVSLRNFSGPLSVSILIQGMQLNEVKLSGGCPRLFENLPPQGVLQKIFLGIFANFLAVAEVPRSKLVAILCSPPSLRDSNIHNTDLPHIRCWNCMIAFKFPSQFEAGCHLIHYSDIWII